MSIKILTKNSIDNTNIDGARQNHFSAGMRSGIVKGSLNEGRFFASASNIIALDTCVLLISGHQVVIDSVQYITLSNKPATPTRYSMIASISVNDSSEPTFRLFIQPASNTLIKENLFNSENGKGTYEIKIGNFTLDTNGNIIDVVKVIDNITGGSDNNGRIINLGNITTETLNPGMQAEVDVDERYDEEEDKTYIDFNFAIPQGADGDSNLSDYLPLSAGSGKPLSGILYANKGVRISSDSAMRFEAEAKFITPHKVIRFGSSSDNNSDLLVMTQSYLRPNGNGTALGTTSHPWKEIYGTAIYQNNKQVANKEDIPKLGTTNWIVAQDSSGNLVFTYA